MDLRDRLALEDNENVVTIVSSTFTTDAQTQRDGRRYARETHTDNVGLQHVVNYLAAIGTDFAAVMNARAPVIAQQLADLEFALIVASTGYGAVYQTKAEFAARFRAAYKVASRDDLARLAYWLIERINDGTFTDAQVQNAFGLTAQQYTAMKARAQTLHDDWAVVLAAVGE